MALKRKPVWKHRRKTSAPSTWRRSGDWLQRNSITAVAAGSLLLALLQTYILLRQTEILRDQTSAAQVQQVDQLRDQVRITRNLADDFLRLSVLLQSFNFPECKGTCGSLTLDKVLPLPTPGQDSEAMEGRAKIRRAANGLRQMLLALQPLHKPVDLNATTFLWMPEEVKTLLDEGRLRCARSDDEFELTVGAFRHVASIGVLLNADSPQRRDVVLDALNLDKSNEALERLPANTTVEEVLDLLQLALEIAKRDVRLMGEACMNVTDASQRTLRSLVGAATRSRN